MKCFGADGSGALFVVFVRVRFTKLEAVLVSVILVAGALAFNDILYKIL